MSRHLPWEQRLVAALCESKASGYSFEVGWAIAVREHPPRSRVEQEIAPDVRRFCSDAWEGRRPKLRYFRFGLADTLDWSGSARHRPTSVHARERTA